MRTILVYNEGLHPYLLFSRLINKSPETFSALVCLPTIPRHTKTHRPSTGILKKLSKSSPSYLFMGLFLSKIYHFVASLFGNTITALATRKGLTVIHASCIDDALIRTITDYQPSWIINASSAILKKNILEIPEQGVLNYHCAPLPEFRGAANYFWLLAEGAKAAHGTLHYVDEGLDTGPIIATTSPTRIRKDTTVMSLWREIRLGSFDLFNSIQPNLSDGIPLDATQQEHARAVVRSFPTRADVRRLRQNGHGICSSKDFLWVLQVAVKGLPCDEAPMIEPS